MKQEIRERIKQIQKGVVPEGYKKDKVGMSPHDWNIKKLSQIANQIERKNNGESYPVLTISSLHGFLDQGERFAKIIAGENLAEYTLLEKNEFAYNKGNSKTYPQGCIFRLEKYDKALVPNVYISFKIEEGNSEYYKHYFIAGLLSHQLSRLINAGVRNDGLFNLYAQDFFACKLLCPPLSEQVKIAEIISTFDKAIELKEKLITGKSQQERWLLENLLTGEKRLPGFRGKWKEVRLEEVCKDIIGGGTPPRNTKRYYQGSIPWITVKDLDGAKQKYDSIEHISPDAVVDRTTRIIPKGNLIVSTRMGLGRGFINMVDMAINQDMKGIILDNALVSTEFVYFSYIELHDLLERLGNGSTVKGIDVQTLKKLKINLPPLSEQTAIAEILSVADREIRLHERHLEELKKQKKALMQLLLTGIVRVNGQEVS